MFEVTGYLTRMKPSKTVYAAAAKSQIQKVLFSFFLLFLDTFSTNGGQVVTTTSLNRVILNTDDFKKYTSTKTDTYLKYTT